MRTGRSGDLYRPAGPQNTQFSSSLTHRWQHFPLHWSLYSYGHAPVRLFGQWPLTFRKLTDRAPIPQRLAASRDIGLGSKIRAKGEFHFCGHTLSPISFGFFGLMIAIVLWGTSYKLSLYFPHLAHTSPTQVAKLWLQPRSASLDAVHGVKGKPNRVTFTQALTASHSPLPNQDHATLSPEGRCDQGIVTPARLIPPRSPPSFLICLG